MINKKTRSGGFTLVELLVVISIIAILLGIVTVALRGSRLRARDAQRNADLETMRSGFEIYKADCGHYPLTVEVDIDNGAALIGDGVSTCDSGNVYIASVPNDPLNEGGGVGRSYIYEYIDVGEYVISAALEGSGGSGSTGTCGTLADTSAVPCNHQVTQP